MTDVAVGTLLVDLIEAAVRVEGKGQLNIGKILRAAATALAQTAAAADGFPDDAGRLATDLRSLSDRVLAAGIEGEIAERIALGADLVARGEQSYLDAFPDPWVCRRCGALAPSEPSGSCRGCGAHPLTFERFRPTYWLTEYGPHEVIRRLTDNPALFVEALQAIPGDGMRWKARTGAWSATDVIRHVRDADGVLSTRVKLILDEDDPLLEFQPVFAWTDRAPGQDASVDTVLDAYLASRRAVVERLRTIDPDDWERTGRHEELGRVTLREQASYFAAHELVHLRQIEELRRAFRR